MEFHFVPLNGINAARVDDRTSSATQCGLSKREVNRAERYFIAGGRAAILAS